ncbi:TRPT1 [Acanthosepion pharaonis]|uniref:2'-phosphotransferase n=1 Tax=Acanthosepion pharaonis TaxID=158019 RepID=A0A812D6W4_ACAPH|nr:TRPT1 [Sepia pharaonis]
MTYDGFVNVSDLLQHIPSGYKEEDIIKMVRNDPKKRYAIQRIGGTLQIKATNGHTLPVNISMKTTTKKIGLHGTFMHNWEQIKSQGISRKQRNNIHMASHDPSCKSGIPPNRDIIIEIDIDKAKKDGIKFFESDNGIILSPGNLNGVIEKKYFKRAYTISGSELSLA